MNIHYKPIIGLEVHVELKTKSKMFCGCSAQHFGVKPNTHVCPICLGLPGALPVPNKKAIDGCMMIGLALNCEIPLFSKFDRKNYFYPDLPKGYQISQYDQPFCVNGWVNVKSQIQNSKSQINSTLRLLTGQEFKILNSKRIRIRRVHMEEDTGKLVHSIVNGEKVSLIDFNRSGVPLVEIVTEPDFESAAEVKECLQKLQQIVRYLGVSNADMDKGEMRLEPNISVQGISNFQFGKAESISNNNLPKYKVEVKNINSFSFSEKAINYEIERQRKILESGKTPMQETRGWDSDKQITVSQRVKEEAMDYRYFPEPDIPPIRFAQDQISIRQSRIKSQIPELPDQKRERFKKEYQLSDYDIEILIREREIADYFEEACRAARGISNFQYRISNKDIANWIINKKIDPEKVLPAEFVRKILESKKIKAIDIKELEATIEKVVKSNLKAVSDYKKGKKNVIMFLTGQVMRYFSHKIDPKIVKENIEKMLQ